MHFFRELERLERKKTLLKSNNINLTNISNQFISLTNGCYFLLILTTRTIYYVVSI